MPDQRLNDLLARQAIAANVQRERDRQGQQAADKAAARRAFVEKLWPERSRNLDEAIARLNELMVANDVQLHRRWADNSGPAGQIERVEVGFSAHDFLHSDMRCVMFHIHADGGVHARMATKNHMPAKEDRFSLEDADVDRWMASLIDFVDVNTPSEGNCEKALVC
jgi:FAD/FMN-containing dehydrogenase